MHLYLHGPFYYKNNNGILRIHKLQLICLFSSTPFATSITTITLSTAVNVLKCPRQNPCVVYREYLFFCLDN
jgi:hypothetical protein